MKREEEIQQKAREEAWYIADTSQIKEEAAIGGFYWVPPMPTALASGWEMS